MDSLLITGGTGTVGRALVRKAMKRSDIAQIIIYSRDEAGQVSMGRETDFRTDKIKYVVGDVTDMNGLYLAMVKYKVTKVIHAAALKHVPVCEKQPSECINVNVLGSRNVLDAAVRAGVKRVVLVSTDKAATPTSAYGLSKALMERLMYEYDGLGGLSVNTTRFGNLIASRGSVVELFLTQIKKTGSVTATDVNMTRFFMRVTHAADTVLSALTVAESRLIFVPQMKAAKLGELIQATFQIARVSPTNIQVIGARPGEKLHECIVSPDEMERAGLLSEFNGAVIGQKVLPEDRRAPIVANSEIAPQMDSDELHGMLMEAQPFLVA